MHTRIQKRRMNLRFKKYSITYDQYIYLLNEQNGKCYICEQVDDKHLAVDHCHTTGVVRGLLCSKCNTTLGKFNDNVDLFKRMIQYLEKDPPDLSSIESNVYTKDIEDRKRWRLVIHTPGRSFSSAEEAGRHYNVNAITIHRWCGRRGTDPKLGWSFEKIMGSLNEVEELIKERKDCSVLTKR